MAAPSIRHFETCRKLEDFLEGKKCKVFMASVDVVLFERKDKEKRGDSKYLAEERSYAFGLSSCLRCGIMTKF